MRSGQPVARPRRQDHRRHAEQRADRERDGRRCTAAGMPAPAPPTQPASSVITHQPTASRRHSGAPGQRRFDTRWRGRLGDRRRHASPANTSSAGEPSCCRGGGRRPAAGSTRMSGSGWAIRLDSAKPPGSSSTWVACAAKRRPPRRCRTGDGTATATSASSARKPTSSALAPQVAGRHRRTPRTLPVVAVAGRITPSTRGIRQLAACRGRQRNLMRRNMIGVPVAAVGVVGEQHLRAASHRSRATNASTARR